MYIIKKHRILFCSLISFTSLMISGLFQWDSSPITGWDKIVGDIAITVMCVMLILMLRIKEGAGFQKNGFVKGITLGIPFYVIGIGAAAIGGVGMDFKSISFKSIGFILLFTLNMLFVGVNEEIMLRSFILNFLKNKYGETEKGIIKSIYISSVIFGLIHLSNLFFMEPLSVIVQVINAMSAGVLFSVIFIKCQNIWANIVIHMVVDFISLFLGQCTNVGNSVLTMNMTIKSAIFMIVAGSVPPLVISWIYFKKYFKKYIDIVKIFMLP